VSSWQHGTGFRMCGPVVRKPYVNQARTFASLVIGTPGKKGEVKHELRAFDADVIDEIAGLGIGQIVKVTGALDREALTDKARNDVKADGYTVFVEKLTIRTLEVEGSSRRPGPSPAPGAAESPPPNDPPPADENYGFR